MFRKLIVFIFYNGNILKKIPLILQFYFQIFKNKNQVFGGKIISFWVAVSSYGVILLEVVTLKSKQTIGLLLREELYHENKIFL